MPPNDQSQRARSRAIVERVVGAMYANLQELPYTVLAPAIYDIYLHPLDHAHLEGIFPHLQSEIGRKLDDEIARLNKREGLKGRLWKLVSKIPGVSQLPLQIGHGLNYTCAQKTWSITFYGDAGGLAAVADDGGALEPGEVAVWVELADPAKPQLDARFKTFNIVTFRKKGMTRATKVGAARPSGKDTVARPAPASPETMAPLAEGRRVLARLSYQDRSGSHTYEMTKDSIVIGRAARDYWADVSLDASDAISREHLEIGHDAGSGKFWVKDKSVGGTMLNGIPVPCSIKTVAGGKQDLDLKMPLPATARLALAGREVIIDFQAMENPA